MLEARHARESAESRRAKNRAEPTWDYYWSVVSKSMHILVCLQKCLLFVIAVA